MTKLISGRVKKTPSANVSASRYEFIRLSETEPDLGVPAANGYILTANVDGTRRWAAITANEATNAITANFANTAGTANTSLRSNVATQADSANTAVFATSSNTSNIALRANVATQADSANTALRADVATLADSANTAGFASSSAEADIALRANVATQADSANTAVFATSSNTANTATRANVATQADSSNTAVFATSSSTANTSLRSNVATQADSANTALRADVATLADSANTAGFATNSTTANTVLSISNFTTSNLAEGTNLYYTNARVYSNVLAMLPTYTGNIGAGNVVLGSGAGGSIIGANLISANNVSATNWLNLYTANVIETAGNLYFTNARVFANVSPLLDRKANVVDLTTANVAELNNLYYTNARVLSNVTAYLAANPAISTYGNANVGAYLTTYTGNISAGNIIANTIITGTGTGGSFTGANLITAGNISATTWLNLYTANVIESPDSLYYTNARVLANVTPLLDRKANVVDLTTANVAELNNLYYTNARVRSAITGGTGVAVDSASGIISIGQNVSTSSNVTFGGLNVTGPVNFYGNVTTHSSNNLSISDNMIYLNNGSPSANPDLGIAFNYNDGVYHNAGFFRDATDGTFKVFDNYDPEPDANIFINTDHASFRLANLSATTLFGNVQGTVSTLSNFTTSNLAEGTNKYFSNALARAALSAGDSTIIYDPVTGTIRATANVTATIETTVNNLSTANVTESNSNLYYTNARVYSNVLALLPTLAGDNIVISANGRISANLSTTVFATSVIGLNTANVSESNSNLYYTNARVLSNVTAYLAANPVISTYGNANVGAYLTTYTGNINAGNVIANNFISTAPGTGTLTATGDFNIVSGGNIRLTGNVYANTFISTATGAGSISSTTDFNLIAAGNILLNAPNVLANGTIVANRITANLWSGIYTANVIESASNLYFTNARVISALSAGSGIAISGNGQISSTTTLTATAVTGLNTANVNEFGGNLYYSNARVLSNVTAYLAANPVISTYGNANVGAFLTTYTGNINAGNVIANAIISGTGLGGSITGANLISANNISASVITANTIIGGGSGGSVTGANLISTNNISSVNWIGLYTANVIETSGNLYFTNARVQSNVIGFLPSLAGDNITIAANGRISATASATVNVLTIVGLTTANVSESNSNLYYTNARVLSNVTAYLAANPQGGTFGNANVGAFLTTYTGNINAGNINANAIIAGQGLGGSITGANLISANNISASVIFANTIIGGGSGGSITGANLISTNTITAVNWVGLYTANVIETSGNLYFTNARVISALSAGSGIAISGNGQISSTTTLTATSVTGLNTANVNEFGGNLYYSNARVVSNVIAYLAANPAISTYGNANVGAFLTTYTGNISAGNVIANSFVAAATGTGTLTATGDFNIVSSGNIRLTGNVFANTFISTATGTGSITSTSNFNINAAGNVSITAANINLNSNNIVATGNVTATKFFGDGSSLTGVGASSFSGNTNGITEGTNNLYYTNTRVYSNVIALLPTLAGNNITIEANGRISANVSATVFATSIIGLTTANVAEVGSNLYFTNARVVSALTAGEGITLAANGLISGGVHAITDSQTFAGGNANITLGTSVSLARRIIVTIDGLVQIPTTDYTVSGTILTLIPTPSPNSTIEVKFFGNEAITTQTFNPFLLAGL